MKEQLLTYLGFRNGCFCFRDASEKDFVFKHSRVDLIREFKLRDKENVNKQFNARYFIQSTAKADTYILTDLTLVS